MEDITGEPYQRIMVRMPKDEGETLQRIADEKGIPLGALCRNILQGYLIRQDVSEEIERKIREILESDKYDDIFRVKVARALGAQK